MPLFVRFGDAGDYESFAGIGEFLESLSVNGICTPLEPHNSLGVQTADYQGNNYISLYFGADVETPIRGLTEEELAFVNRQIGNHTDGEVPIAFEVCTAHQR